MADKKEKAIVTETPDKEKVTTAIEETSEIVTDNTVEENSDVVSATEEQPKASLADRLRELAAKVSGTSPLTTGRSKIDTHTICSYESLTLRDFDFISYTDKTTGDSANYPVLIFDEIDDGFYCGGMALSDLCKAIQADKTLYEELKTSGLKMSFNATLTKTNKTYVNFVVL